MKSSRGICSFVNRVLKHFDTKAQTHKPKADLDDLFWEGVDRYESGDLDENGLMEYYIEINDGNLYEAQADFDLALGR